MAKVKSIAGENWGICGKMNTGKTYTTLELAGEVQRKSGKKIVVFDPNNNSSYSEIDLEFGIEDFTYVDQFEENSIYKLTNCLEYSEFLSIATTHCHNSILILDDCGNEFSGNLTATQMAFITASKNNGNDVFFQFHNFNDIAPKLCQNFQMVVIKEQAAKEIPSKVPSNDFLNILLEEVRADNDQNDPEELWAYRIYDIYRDRVFFEDDNGIITMEYGRAYFKDYY